MPGVGMAHVIETLYQKNHKLYTLKIFTWILPTELK